jgi:hypothetical protein
MEIQVFVEQVQTIVEEHIQVTVVENAVTSAVGPALAIKLLKAPMDIYRSVSRDVPPTLRVIGEQELRVALDSFAKAQRADTLENYKLEFSHALLCLKLSLERFEDGGTKARDSSFAFVPTGRLQSGTQVAYFQHAFECACMLASLYAMLPREEPDGFGQAGDRVHSAQLTVATEYLGRSVRLFDEYARAYLTDKVSYCFRNPFESSFDGWPNDPLTKELCKAERKFLLFANKINPIEFNITEFQLCFCGLTKHVCLAADQAFAVWGKPASRRFRSCDPDAKCRFDTQGRAFPNWGHCVSF